MTTDGLAVTWWGHAFATIELSGTTVVTDPVLGDRLGHLGRHAPTPSSVSARADVVLLSHLHGDHLHVSSLQRFTPGTVVVVPAGGERLLRRVHGLNVLPVRPGERVGVGAVVIDVLPATHDGRRSPVSRVTAPALGFRVRSGGLSFWYPGDTELRRDMTAAGPVDLALVPIGGWGPTLDDGHMDPDAGAEAVGMVGARWALPVHWGTWWPMGLRVLMPRNHERLFRTPGERFAAALHEQGVGTELLLPRHGERMQLVA